MTDILVRMLTLHEGRKNKLYKDTKGLWTIGVGHLIDPSRGATLPEPVIDLLLECDIKEKTDQLQRDIPWMAHLDPVRVAVLMDMAFNLGDTPFNHDGVNDWPVFVEQVRTGQYAAAAANMRSTLWYKQVGQRGERLATMMETGEWPTDV